MEEEQNYILFKIFRTEEDAEFFIDILKDSGIDYKLDKNERIADNAIIGSAGDMQSMMQNNYLLLINESDFDKARIELQKNISEYLNNADTEENTLLKDFTDEELMEVIKLPDEWSEEDVIMSQILLKNRGKNISNEEVEIYRQKRIEQLCKPKFIGWTNIIAGYIFAILGGIIGIIIAAPMLGRKRIFSGDKVYEYDSVSRLNGKIIMAISLIVCVGLIVYWFLC